MRNTVSKLEPENYSESRIQALKETGKLPADFKQKDSNYLDELVKINDSEPRKSPEDTIRFYWKVGEVLNKEFGPAPEKNGFSGVKLSRQLREKGVRLNHYDLASSRRVHTGFPDVDVIANDPTMTWDRLRRKILPDMFNVKRKPQGKNKIPDEKLPHWFQELERLISRFCTDMAVPKNLARIKSKDYADSIKRTITLLEKLLESVEER